MAKYNHEQFMRQSEEANKEFLGGGIGRFAEEVIFNLLSLRNNDNSFTLTMNDSFFKKGDILQMSGYERPLTVLKVIDNNQLTVGYPSLWWRFKYWISAKFETFLQRININYKH